MRNQRHRYWQFLVLSLMVGGCGSDSEPGDGGSPTGSGASGSGGDGASPAGGAGGSASSASGGAGIGGGPADETWSKRFGDVGAQSANKVAVDSHGNVALAVQFVSNVDFGGETFTAGNAGGIFPSMAVAVFDAEGNHLWSRALGAGGAPPGIAFDALNVAFDLDDNLVVAGTFTKTSTFGGEVFTSAGDAWGDVFVAKYDGTGNHLWSKHFGSGQGNWLTDLTIDPFGDVLLSGNFCGPIDFGGGPLPMAPSPEGGGVCTDVFVAKFDPAGNHLLSKSLGNGYLESDGFIASNRAPGGTGDFMVVANTQYPVTIGGTTLDFGSSDSFTWMAILSAAGAPVAVRGVPRVFPSGLVSAADGSFTLTGGCAEDADFGSGPIGASAFVARYDSSGNLEFAVPVDGGYPYDVALTADLGIVVSGTSVSGGSGSAYAAAFDAAGVEVWHHVFVDPKSTASGIAVDTSGRVVLAGSFSNDIDFGSGELHSAGEYDAFLATFFSDDASTVLK